MVTSKMGTYFESKVRVEKMTEYGTQAKFNELYVVNAMSFTETESKIIGFLSEYAQGEFDVITEVRARYKEIFISDDEAENIFYKVKVDFITQDEVSGKEKHSRNDILVQGMSIETAKKNVDEVLGGTMVDYRILGVTETAVMDIIE